MKIKLILLFLIALPAFASTKIIWGIDKELYYHAKVAKKFKTEIAQATQGRVEIEIQMFEEKSLNQSAHDLIQSGRFQMTQYIAGNFSNQDQLLRVWELPFLFDGFSHAEKYIVSNRAKNVLRKLSENSNIEYVDYSYSGGPLLILSDFKANSLKDFAGKELALSIENGFGHDFLAALGVKTSQDKDPKTAANFEILAAGAEAIYGKENIHDLWLNVTNHRIVTRLVFVSKQSLKQMTESDQKVFLDQLKKLLVEERKLSMQGASLAYSIVQNRGANVNVWTEKQRAQDTKLFNEVYHSKYSDLKNEVKFINSLNPKFGPVYQN